MAGYWVRCNLSTTVAVVGMRVTATVKVTNQISGSGLYTHVTLFIKDFEGGSLWQPLNEWVTIQPFQEVTYTAAWDVPYEPENSFEFKAYADNNGSINGESSVQYLTVQHTAQQATCPEILESQCYAQWMVGGQEHTLAYDYEGYTEVTTGTPIDFYVTIKNMPYSECSGGSIQVRLIDTEHNNAALLTSFIELSDNQQIDNYAMGSVTMPSNNISTKFVSYRESIETGDWELYSEGAYRVQFRAIAPQTCTNGQTRCKPGGNVEQICTNNQWIDQQPVIGKCGYTGTGCTAPVGTQGSCQCISNVMKRCTNSAWVADTSCANTCTAPECTNGATRCKPGGTVKQQCVNQKWVDTLNPCETNGDCVPDDDNFCIMGYKAPKIAVYGLVVLAGLGTIYVIKRRNEEYY